MWYVAEMPWDPANPHPFSSLFAPLSLPFLLVLSQKSASSTTEVQTLSTLGRLSQARKTSGAFPPRFEQAGIGKSATIDARKCEQRERKAKISRPKRSLRPLLCILPSFCFRWGSTNSSTSTGSGSASKGKPSFQRDGPELV